MSTALAFLLAGGFFPLPAVPAVVLAFRWRTRVGRRSSGGRRHWIRRGHRVILVAVLAPMVLAFLFGLLAVGDSAGWLERVPVNGSLLAPLIVVGAYYFLATRDD